MVNKTKQNKTKPNNQPTKQTNQSNQINQPILWSRVLEKLTVTQLVKNTLPFMVSKGSLLCSQESATGPYPEPDESSPHLPILFP
jgi:hypothetical protein